MNTFSDVLSSFVCLNGHVIGEILKRPQFPILNANNAN